MAFHSQQDSASRRAAPGTVGLLADDLTGALDAAAPFASKDMPVAVVWARDRASRRESFAFDTETRDSDPIAASERVGALLQRLQGYPIAFKKVDSLLRGNTMAELSACCASKEFGAVVIAPAFPDQGRVTRGGRQFARDAEGAWIPVGADIVEAVAGKRRRAKVVKPGEALEGGGIAVCDAETPSDLARLTAARGTLPEPVLWCGSAGLARALAGQNSNPSRPTGRRRLVLVGSPHGVAMNQLLRTREQFPRQIAIVRGPNDIDPVAAWVEADMDAHGVAVVAFAMEACDPAAAADLHCATFARFGGLTAPDLLVVVGGDTLFRLSDALGANRLDAIGEWMPGVAVSRFADGSWKGATVISKSGAFGGSDALVQIIKATDGREHA